MLDKLFADWMAAKSEEKAAVERRRAIEDVLKDELVVIDSQDSTQHYHIDGYAIKVVSRLDRKVDADLLQEIAAENGLNDHLQSLFRWKPEINLTAWKSANTSITDKLAGAVIIKPGRPSFTITKE